MLTKMFISAALLATSALGAAVPSTNSAVENAEKRGINVQGSIPHDAVAIPGGFTFEYGTDASAWVLAQIALGESSTNIGVGMFVFRDCEDGHGVWFDDVEYNTKYVDVVPARYWSVGIAGRALSSTEKLEFSQKGRGSDNIGDYCATPISSATPGTGVGCFNVQDINCFKLSQLGQYKYYPVLLDDC